MGPLPTPLRVDSLRLAGPLSLRLRTGFCCFLSPWCFLWALACSVPSFWPLLSKLGGEQCIHPPPRACWPSKLWLSAGCGVAANKPSSFPLLSSGLWIWYCCTPGPLHLTFHRPAWLLLAAAAGQTMAWEPVLSLLPCPFHGPGSKGSVLCCLLLVYGFPSHP